MDKYSVCMQTMKNLMDFKLDRFLIRLSALYCSQTANINPHRIIHNAWHIYTDA